jgi:hypothetical protein
MTKFYFSETQNEPSTAPRELLKAKNLRAAKCAATRGQFFQRTTLKIYCDDVLQCVKNTDDTSYSYSRGWCDA